MFHTCYSICIQCTASDRFSQQPSSLEWTADMKGDLRMEIIWSFGQENQKKASRWKCVFVCLFYQNDHSLSRTQALLIGQFSGSGLNLPNRNHSSCLAEPNHLGPSLELPEREKENREYLHYFKIHQSQHSLKIIQSNTVPRSQNICSKPS